MCMLTCELQEALIGAGDSHVACRCAWMLLFALLLPNHLTTDDIPNINISLVYNKFQGNNSGSRKLSSKWLQ